jgi:hypothetical protein
MIDWIEANCQWLVLGGLALLMVVLVVSFLFKTAWGSCRRGLPHIPKEWVPPMPPVKPPAGEIDITTLADEGFRTFDREWRDID